MKKIVFLVVALSCCSFVFAQKGKNSGASNHENRPLYFGVSVGPTVDWFAPTTKDFKLVRERPKAGFIAGINVDVNLTKGKWLYFSTGLLMRYLQGELAFENQYIFSKFVMITDTLVLSTVRTFQASYLVIPTGVKFRTPPSRGCVFVGKVGLYHQFKLGGDKFDSFSFPDLPGYFITTPKVKNDAAALFAETGYAGIGFEYIFKSNIRVFMNADYACQFNYFSSKAVSNVVADARFRAIVHSLHVTFGILF
ncbi:MAG: outer membrane beta-barrel protein [Lentimicrobiaceae bacterium]|nr:outer membrane beta-barrel protein [Lentimicrobiaceae bacterium]